MPIMLACVGGWRNRVFVGSVVGETTQILLLLLMLAWSRLFSKCQMFLLALYKPVFFNRRVATRYWVTKPLSCQNPLLYCLLGRQLIKEPLLLTLRLTYFSRTSNTRFLILVSSVRRSCRIKKYISVTWDHNILNSGETVTLEVTVTFAKSLLLVWNRTW